MAKRANGHRHCIKSIIFEQRQLAATTRLPIWSHRSDKEPRKKRPEQPHSRKNARALDPHVRPLKPACLREHYRLSRWIGPKRQPRGTLLLVKFLSGGNVRFSKPSAVYHSIHWPGGNSNCAMHVVAIRTRDTGGVNICGTMKEPTHL